MHSKTVKQYDFEKKNTVKRNYYVIMSKKSQTKTKNKKCNNNNKPKLKINAWIAKLKKSYWTENRAYMYLRKWTLCVSLYLNANANIQKLYWQIKYCMLQKMMSKWLKLFYRKTANPKTGLDQLLNICHCFLNSSISILSFNSIGIFVYYLNIMVLSRYSTDLFLLIS